MEQQYSFYYSGTYPRTIPMVENNMYRSSTRPKLEPELYGGVPMQASNSAQSAYSNISHESYSSVNTASTPITAYGSYDAPAYISTFNNNGIAGAGYADTGYSTARQEANLDQHQSPSYDDEPPHHTPSSLQWTPDTKLPELYDFHVKKGKPPYLELKPEFFETAGTPKTVFLDEHSIDQRKGTYPCMFPGNCVNRKGQPSTFSRPADLERHYINVHSEEGSKQKFFCSHSWCQRAKEPFTRKDHYRDHLRDYHKEDLGFARRPKEGCETEEQWVAFQGKWKDERVISWKYWRCAKTLDVIRVSKDGWECPTCKLPCEPERIEARLRKKAAEEGAAGMPQQQPEVGFSEDGTCLRCNGYGATWVEGQERYSGDWVSCEGCQGGAVSYDMARNEDFQMDFEYAR